MLDTSSLPPMRRNLGVAIATLIAGTGTLVCCVLPAVMVSLGAGASLAGLITSVPQLIWLSEHKSLVFGVAGALLGLSGAQLWHARTLSCPADPALSETCARLRRVSWVLWAAAMLCTTVGTLFAFVLPKLY